jgi:HTH-type transcriptional regulator, glycine betaine synthesis regulator
MTEPNNLAPNNADLKIVHNSLLDGLGQLATYFGFNKLLGQIYGAILLTTEPITLDHLVNQLGISKANASINMRTLERLGMVRQVSVRGEGKRKFYEAEADFWAIISSILAGREMRDISRALSVLTDSAQRLDKSKGEMTEEEQKVAALYMDRIAQLQALFRFAQNMMGTILARDFEDIQKIDIE